MSFFDDLLRTLRAPLDFMRGKTSSVRNFEGQIRGNINRVRQLPNEVRSELQYNKQQIQQYGQQAKQLKDQAGQYRNKLGQPGQQAGQPNNVGAAPQPGAKKKKMGLFSKKKRCPSCNEKLEARWELCPYCGFGGQVDDGGAPSGGAPPRTQALDVGSGGNYGGGNYGGGGGGNKPRTMALDIGGIGSGGGGGGVAPGGSSTSRLVAWIIPLDGPQGGSLLELRARSIVGTAPDCDVMVSDPSVSGRHAEFSAQAGVFRVSDLGSTNGTFVNDKRVTQSELVDGDTLRLGRTSFKFKST